jgi:hypothetical protein
MVRKQCLKTPKGLSETTNRRTYNSMAKTRRTYNSMAKKEGQIDKQ